MADPAIRPGDRVSIREHRRAPELYPRDYYTVPASTGWVVTDTQDSRKASGAPFYFLSSAAHLVRLRPDGEHETEFAEPEYLVLEAAGRGQFEFGVDIPFSKLQLAQQRYAEFVQKAREALEELVANGYQGYPNAATFLAALYLRNEHRWMEQERPRLTRKDGTLNPARVQKAFRDLHLKVDSWAYDLPIDVPPEFERHSFANLKTCLRVRWDVVANDFRKEIEHAHG